VGLYSPGKKFSKKNISFFSINGKNIRIRNLDALGMKGLNKEGTN
jgi:hypothetical protein